ncbi:MAG: divergent polysaccharide deacetylase family protein [Chitinispirillia bacterium]|nr:divergent polysaccharide deacetylase family protein [Chitinispirillia bacterium]MCL2269249.1 divergent polysaccharide deacetylase family protein [Chitinispirillia bacterium]
MKNKKKTPAKAAKNGKKGFWLPVLVLLALVAGATFTVPVTRDKAAGALQKATSRAAAVSGIDPHREKIKELTFGTEATKRLWLNLADRFAALEMRDTSDYALPKDSATIIINAAVPLGPPMEQAVWEMVAAAAGTPYYQEDGVCAGAAARARCTVTFVSKNPQDPNVSLRVQRTNRYNSNTGKMAILVENVSLDYDGTALKYLTFPEPLTVSILSTNNTAAQTAQRAIDNQKEVVLSLPMSPLPARFDTSVIKPHYSDIQIASMFNHAAARLHSSIKGVSGFSDHRSIKENTRITLENPRAMKIILAETKKRHAYFVYPKISRRPITQETIDSAKVPNMEFQRTIDSTYLELTQDSLTKKRSWAPVPYTHAQLRDSLHKYSSLARIEGQVLLKAQPSQAFIEVLREQADTLKRNGIRLVYVSELLK